MKECQKVLPESRKFLRLPECATKSLHTSDAFLATAIARDRIATQDEDLERGVRVHGVRQLHETLGPQTNGMETARKVIVTNWKCPSTSQILLRT